ncbi:hypothetical protein LDENG_00033920 [Lucifuga dentata]|nr:hypothetical protein LDENG_00033920 [Lucifuga dentata]
MKMRTSSGLLVVLMICCLSRAQKLSNDDSLFLPAPNVARQEEIQRPKTEDKEGEHDLTVQSDIWDELRNLRDMVVEQKVELRHLTTRVTAAESLVEALQRENTAMEARMTTAESLTRELQTENDAKDTELAIAQQNINNLQERLTTSERYIEQLKKDQEGQMASVQELQHINSVSKVAFSASLLASGEGNTGSKDFVQLIFRNVFTNVGNHYNVNTGYFTAPVRGAYYFRCTGHIAHSDESMKIRLVKNGHPIVFAADRDTTSSADAEDNASNGVVLHMEVGDVVSLQISGFVWDDHYHRTTFSGFLLFLL